MEVLSLSANIMTKPGYYGYQTETKFEDYPELWGKITYAWPHFFFVKVRKFNANNKPPKFVGKYKFTKDGKDDVG